MNIMGVGNLEGKGKRLSLPVGGGTPPLLPMHINQEASSSAVHLGYAHVSGKRFDHHRDQC